MEKSSVDGTVVAAVSEVSGKPESEILLDTKLDELDIDSLDFVDLMQILEIEQPAWSRIATVGDLAREKYAVSA